MRRPAARFLLLVAAGAAATFAAMLLLWAAQGTVLHEFVRRADPGVTDFVRGFYSPWMTPVMVWLSKFGGWKGMFLTTLFIVVLLVRVHRWRDAVGFGVAVGCGHGLNRLMKAWFERPRPEVNWALAHEPTFSFPSGHAFIAVVFYGMVLYLIWHAVPRRWARVALTVAIAVPAFLTGISRIYLGVHYPSDIFAGFLAGSVWLAFLLAATRALHPRPAVES